jgi:hypothetical protein
LLWACSFFYKVDTWKDASGLVDEERRTYSYSEKKGIEWKATDFKDQGLASLAMEDAVNHA